GFLIHSVRAGATAQARGAARVGTKATTRLAQKNPSPASPASDAAHRSATSPRRSGARWGLGEPPLKLVETPGEHLAPLPRGEVGTRAERAFRVRGSEKARRSLAAFGFTPGFVVETAPTRLRKPLPHTQLFR